MAKILLIGATGFLGRHLVKKLKNHELSYFDRKIHDITNLNDVVKATKGQDIVINLAAPNTQNSEINRRVIVEGSKNIIESAKRNNIQKVIHLSSAAVYRKNQDSYGIAKREADELYIQSGISAILLRPPLIYGRGGYAAEKLFNSVEKIPFIVLVVGDGKYKFQPVYVEDVVDAIVASIDYKKKGISIFDVAGPRKIEFNKFAEKILKAKGVNKILIHIPISLILFVVRILTFFFRSLPFNTTTIKRMVEEIDLDVDKTKKELGVAPREYDEALLSLFA